MQFLQKDAVRLYTLRPPAPHSGGKLGMAWFREEVLVSWEMRLVFALLRARPKGGYLFRFAATDAPTVLAAYASYLDQLEAWPNTDGTWSAYTSIDPDLLIATYEAHMSTTHIERLASGHQIILLQREALQTLRVLMVLQLTSPQIMTLLEEVLKGGVSLRDTGRPAMLPGIIAQLDALCRAVRSLLESASE